MKKSLIAVSLAAVSAFADPAIVGIEANAGYNILSVGSSVDDGNTKSQPSFGFAVGPTIALPFNEQFAISGKISFQYDMNRTETKIDGPLGIGSYKAENNQSQMSVGFQVAPVFHLSPMFAVKAGYEWDMPLGGSRESKQTTSLGPISYDSTFNTDLVWAPSKASDLKSNETPVVSTHNLILGAAFSLTPTVDFTVQGKFALNGSGADYKSNGDLNGAASTDNNIAVHQVALGINVSFL